MFRWIDIDRWLVVVSRYKCFICDLVGSVEDSGIDGFFRWECLQIDLEFWYRKCDIEIEVLSLIYWVGLWLMLKLRVCNRFLKKWYRFYRYWIGGIEFEISSWSIVDDWSCKYLVDVCRIVDFWNFGIERVVSNWRYRVWGIGLKISLVIGV